MDPDGWTEPADTEDADPDELSELAIAIVDETAVGVGEPAEAAEGRRAFKIIHPARKGRRLKRSRKRSRGSPDSGVRLKALPLLGALLGLSSFALPWDSLPAYSRESFHRLGDYVVMYPSDYSYVLAVAAALVLVGAILLFLTSFGGIIQLSGIGLFVYGVQGDLSHLEIGFVTCLCGAVLGVSSLFIRAPLEVPLRLLTVAPGKAEGRGLQVELTSVGCFLVGATACFLPWFVQSYSWRYSQYYPMDDYERFNTLISFVFEQNQDLLLVTGASVFVIGAILALLTPLGGIAQGVGVTAFFLGIQPQLSGGSSTYGGYAVSYDLGLGFYVGIIAAAMGVVGLVLPLRVGLPTGSLTVSGSERSAQNLRGLKERLSGLSSAVESAVPRLLAIAVALTVILSSSACVAALAYTQKWSSVMIWVNAYAPQEEEVEIAIQVDGLEVFSEVVSSYSQVITKTQVRAGTHKVSIDYCFLSIDPDGIDGVLDWSTYCQARPFSKTNVLVEIGSYRTIIRSVGLETSPVENGTEVVFGSFDSDGMWTPSVSWDDITLTLTDGISHVYWALRWDPSLWDGILTEKTYDNRTLGETNISCSITDLYGNGCVNPGDFVTLSALDGTSFSPDVTYTLLVMYDRQSSLIGECELVLG